MNPNDPNLPMLELVVRELGYHSNDSKWFVEANLQGLMWTDYPAATYLRALTLRKRSERYRVGDYRTVVRADFEAA